MLGQPINDLVLGGKWLEFISQSQKKGDYNFSTYLTLSTGTKIKLSGGLLPVNVWNFFSSGTSGQWSRIKAAEVVSVSGGAAASERRNTLTEVIPENTSPPPYEINEKTKF